MITLDILLLVSLMCAFLMLIEGSIAHGKIFGESTRALHQRIPQ